MSRDRKLELPGHMSIVIGSDKAMAMLDAVKDGRINGAKISQGDGQYVDLVAEALIDSVTKKRD